MPLAEFQIGLAKLARLSSHLIAPEVFGAIRQAVLCAPWYPESHNMHGLVTEGRHEYESAIASYQLARYAWKTSTLSLPHSQYADISVNLARALCKAGYFQDAVQEVEHLKQQGLLNVEGLQVYAVSLWKLGKNDLSLSAASDLAACVPTIKKSSAAAAVCLYCTLLYSISGAGSAISNILKMPREQFMFAAVSFVVSALDAVDQTNQLQDIVSSSRCSLSSQEDMLEMHLLIALRKLIRNGPGLSLNLQSGINHLRKGLHMFPNGTSLRNLLGYLLLSRVQWEPNHVVRRCAAIVPPDPKMDFRSALEVIGAEAISCYATASCNTEYSLATCKYQKTRGASVMVLMQRWLRREPWNTNARYFLVLNLFQKARLSKYPCHLINALKRMTSTALLNQSSLQNICERYKRFQLLLCSSEFSLLDGDSSSCLSYAKDALSLSLPNASTFFGHLQLCRAHAAEDNDSSLSEEFMRCLNIKSPHPIGWISLKIIESRYRPRSGLSFSDSGFRDSITESTGSWSSWLAVYNFFCGLISQGDGDLQLAEEFFAKACSLQPSESCFFLCHGVICVELTKRQRDSQYIAMGVKSLKRAQELSSIRLPFVHLLLAQAEASLGLKVKWERSLGHEWSSWSPETRPAELYFQMHLHGQHGSDLGNSQSWILRAVHLNPSCSRYWRVLRKPSA